MVLIYVCVIVLAICLYPWWMYRRTRSLLSHLPCLPSLPVVGNLHQLLGDGVHLLTRLAIVSKTMDYQRSPLVFWLGPLPLLGVCDPLDTKAVINHYAEKSRRSIWRHTSKVRGANDVQEILNGQARKLVTQLKTEAGKEPFDAMQKYIGWMAFETICQITFSVPSSGLTKEDYQLASRASELYMGRSNNVPFLLGFLYGITPVSRELAKAEDVLKKLVEKLLNKTKKDRERLDPMMQKRVISELTTYIGAGHHTLANALTMCLLMIGSHPGVQERLYEETKEILADCNRPLTEEDLARMQYCEAVIYETLRLYPFVPLYFLNADKDLKLNKCTVPKNTTCWINVWGAGRARNVWGADTDLFRPERWLEDQQQTTMMTFYIENLTGLGKELSLAMLKTTLGHCVKETVVQSNLRNLRFRMSTYLQPINGHLMRVQPRNYNK